MPAMTTKKKVAATVMAAGVLIGATTARISDEKVHAEMRTRMERAHGHAIRKDDVCAQHDDCKSCAAVDGCAYSLGFGCMSSDVTKSVLNVDLESEEICLWATADTCEDKCVWEMEMVGSEFSGGPPPGPDGPGDCDPETEDCEGPPCDPETEDCEGPPCDPETEDCEGPPDEEPCVGDDCPPDEEPCVGDDCPPDEEPCVGDDCPPDEEPCVGDDCPPDEEPCVGDDCPPDEEPCVGDDCPPDEEPCVGDDCPPDEEPCVGDDCPPDEEPCVGDGCSPPELRREEPCDGPGCEEPCDGPECGPDGPGGDIPSPFFEYMRMSAELSWDAFKFDGDSPDAFPEISSQFTGITLTTLPDWEIGDEDDKESLRGPALLLDQGVMEGGSSSAHTGIWALSGIREYDTADYPGDTPYDGKKGTAISTEDWVKISAPTKSKDSKNGVFEVVIGNAATDPTVSIKCKFARKETTSADGDSLDGHTSKCDVIAKEAFTGAGKGLAFQSVYGGVKMTMSETEFGFDGNVDPNEFGFTFANEVILPDEDPSTGKNETAAVVNGSESKGEVAGATVGLRWSKVAGGEPTFTWDPEVKGDASYAPTFSKDGDEDPTPTDDSPASAIASSFLAAAMTVALFAFA